MKRTKKWMDIFRYLYCQLSAAPTFLVVPLALHLLDDAEVEHGVPGGRAAAQRRQEVPHHGLVPRLARARQPGQVLQDQLLTVLRETLKNNIV